MGCQRNVLSLPWSMEAATVDPDSGEGVGDSRPPAQGHKWARGNRLRACSLGDTGSRCWRPESRMCMHADAGRRTQPGGPQQQASPATCPHRTTPTRLRSSSPARVSQPARHAAAGPRARGAGPWLDSARPRRRRVRQSAHCSSRDTSIVLRARSSSSTPCTGLPAYVTVPVAYGKRATGHWEGRPAGEAGR